ncbi:MAG: hypothetical protein JOZ80_19125 [Acidobacteriaceae bacterium]|nr:hypothetical protein [Acidobacteriaceae bacterium]
MTIEIGETAITLRTGSSEFNRLVRERYSGFINDGRRQQHELEIDLVEGGVAVDLDEDLEVSVDGKHWSMRRGDFRACWNAEDGCGSVHQPSSPYAIDSVLRIIHSLLLADRGGFLLHAASAIRNGSAFLFAGLSGAGKTTISRLAPPDTALLTDEISYVVRKNGRYFAYGTPFAGELGRAGENISAPVKAVFLLNKGPQNCIEDVHDTEAVGSILRNVLFFARDHQLVSRVFNTACEFVNQVPVCRLTFFPDERVWNIIG